MKITRSHLRRIIREELARGTRSRVAESVANDTGVIEKLVKTMIVGWSDMSDLDVHAKPGGHDPWMDQVDLASEELRGRLGEVCDDVEAKLVAGEYATRKGG